MVQASPEKRSQNDILVVLVRSQLLILRILRACAAAEELTLQQFGVLRYLSQKGIVPMGALGDELGVTPPVITGIIDRLETKGFVERKLSDDDRRRTDILLTERGKVSYRMVRESYRSSLQRSLERSLSASEQEKFGEFLSRFTAELYA